MIRRLRGAAPWPIDLAYNPDEPRDRHGRWSAALGKAIAGDTADLVKLVSEDRGPARITMPQLSGVPIPGSKADKAFPNRAPGDEVDLTEQFMRELQHSGVSVQTGETKISDLKPTQDEISGPTVTGLAAYMLHAPKTSPVFEPIFISADNHVIDGHHRWAARTVVSEVNNEPNATMATRKIGLNIADALPIAKQFMREWGLPVVGVDKKTTVSHFANLSNIDLAVPRPVVKYPVPVPVDSDATVRAIAQVLSIQHGYRRTSEDFNSEVAGVEHLLAPYNIRKTAIRMALGLTHTEGGGRRGTAHVPNARLKEHGATLTGTVKDVRDSEVYYRAAYVANAAHRMQRQMNLGANQRQTLRQEASYYRLHEEARQGRLKAAAQVQTAAKMYGVRNERGTLVGWYLNRALHNEVECITANGHNFYAEEGTMLGLPGSVHNRCGCYAGPPHEGATLVNDEMKNVVRLSRARPKFKVKERRTA